MAQYSKGTVSVTNGSATVTGNSTAFLTNVSVGDDFLRTSDGVVYDIAAVVSDTEITLSVPYQGVTGSAVTYTIQRDFTANYGFPYLNQGDIETATITARATKEIDAQLGSFIPEADLASSAPGEGSDLVAHTGTANTVTEALDGVSAHLFTKSDGSAPAWRSPTASTLEVASKLSLAVGSEVVSVPETTAITLPSLVQGTDYYIYVSSIGGLQAVDADAAPPANERLVGGFHVRAGGGEINPYSLWDLNWRPQSSPRGMALSIDGKLWGDIYLMDTQYGVNGYSRNGATIADGGSLPVKPSAYGGDGTAAYTSMSWWVAVDLATAAGKRLPFYQEFTALAYGVVERQAVGTDPVTTQYQAGHRSACGCEQITGALWQWGADINGTTATGAGSWLDIAEGRGDVYTHSIRSPLFGASWSGGSVAGSRASTWGNAPDLSSSNVSARGVSDHVNLQSVR